MAAMGTRLSDLRLFFGEFRRNFRTTGAILPSGNRLSAALAGRVRQRDDDRPRRILEVGHGTGAVTRHIVAALGPNDHLDLVELNPSFVECLRERFRTDPAFQPVADRAQVWHSPVEGLPANATYHVIVSGLPLNNFAVDEVAHILDVLRRLAEPGGTLSFFEYIGIRRVKALVTRPAERTRLRGVGQLVDRFLAQYEVRRDWIWPNVPPAWVHHAQF